jgi:glycerophosphoryl diester phosphodiesterase
MWLYPRIAAHRGGGSLAPENTLAALRCGLAYGFRAVEFDVMLAGDGVPVLMHDFELGRTTRAKGKVANHTARELALMDAGAWFDPAYGGEPVPSFEEAAHFCMEHGIWMNVEIKPSPGTERETGRIVAEYAQRLCASALSEPASLPLLSSFSFEALSAARDAAPALARGMLVTSVPADWLSRLRMLGAVALHVDHTRLTARHVKAVKGHGYGLFCYTVNSPARACALLNWGVDAFCTDRIDLIGPDVAQLAV